MPFSSQSFFQIEISGAGFTFDGSTIMNWQKIFFTHTPELCKKKVFSPESNIKELNNLSIHTRL